MFEKSFKNLNFSSNGMQLKFTVLVHFRAQFTARKPKNITKTQNFCINCILRNNQQRESHVPEKSQNSWKIKPKNIFWAQIGSKLLPWVEGSFKNSHIAYNRTIHLYFLDVKFQLLGICHFRLQPEEITTFFFVQDPFLPIFGFFGAITTVN